MTKKDHIEDDNQQQEQPFQIVLVDIKETLQDGNIRCVEKPLDGISDGSSFVALSYRWGELDETTIDTHLGYLASITSFDLDHLYYLCLMMTDEPDLNDIDYVWVDAVCVDQTNYERRKATIHQMSNIYEKATYILAVPDLHMGYLRSISEANSDILLNIQMHSDYVYHLLKGNTVELEKLDNAFLDKIRAPQDPALRDRLTKDTDYFAKGFTTPCGMSWEDDSMEILDHIYETSQALRNPVPHQDNVNSSMHREGSRQNHYTRIANMATITTGDNACSQSGYYDASDHEVYSLSPPPPPYVFVDNKLPTSNARSKKSWRHQIYERNIAIRQCVKFLTDLIRDWSSRVWVISEYHIAKKKNNLKYWFIALSDKNIDKLPNNVAFFNFDFDEPIFSADVQNHEESILIYSGMALHVHFHSTLIKQLTTRTFMEMILKSKASKNEDRFYAILPQSKYKRHMNQVTNWELKSMVAVKLKLFEIMDTKDKINLLFTSGDYLSSIRMDTLPTFATSNINSEIQDLFFTENTCNFSYNDDTFAPISLHYKHDVGLYSLQVIPKEYYVGRITDETDRDHYYSEVASARKTKLFHDGCQSFKNNDDDDGSVMDIVYISPFVKYDMTRTTFVIPLPDDCISWIQLMGSFAENKWLLTNEFHKHIKKDHHYNIDSNSIVFNIY
ncbi:hypothetical protein BCR42DRAFT_475275 [Absidia repens]|uniref:Heterokaryon incompatibility domain-containing protein n=1 Tax=Absidia repens TaxID=90262 RepID=A0A1X2HX75_9FUNG|nr:hypothetical protein BCR42DRAFT_475275 [Absidia repens]